MKDAVLLDVTRDPVTNEPTGVPTRKVQAMIIVTLIGPIITGAVTYALPQITGACTGQIVEVVSDLALRGEAADAILDAACQSELANAIKVAVVTFVNLAVGSFWAWARKNRVA